MGTDTRDAGGQDAQVEIALRETEFDRLFLLIGCNSLDAIAGEIGMTSRTVRRAKQGVIGEDFIVRTLAALRRRDLSVSFDDIFEIADKAA